MRAVLAVLEFGFWIGLAMIGYCAGAVCDFVVWCCGGEDAGKTLRAL